MREWKTECFFWFPVNGNSTELRTTNPLQNDGDMKQDTQWENGMLEPFYAALHNPRFETSAGKGAAA